MQIFKLNYVKSLVIFILFIFLINQGFNAVQISSNRLQMEALRDAIAQSCAHSYATTGAYPASLEKIYDSYGIQFDETKYIVHYEVFASNIMPDITVIAK